jgi:hypothetical protein
MLGYLTTLYQLQRLLWNITMKYFLLCVILRYFTVVNVNIMVYLDVIPCYLVDKCQHFGGYGCFHLQVKNKIRVYIYILFFTVDITTLQNNSLTLLSCQWCIYLGYNFRYMFRLFMKPSSGDTFYNI